MSQTNTSPLSSGSSSSRSGNLGTQIFKERPGTLDCPYCNGFLIVMGRVDDPTGTPHHTYCSNKRSIDIATRCFGKTIFSKQSDGICYACQDIFMQPAQTPNANSNSSLTSSRRHKIIYYFVMFML